MFNKIGSPQPMSLVNRCHICGESADTSRDGKLLCSSCANADSISQVPEVTQASQVNAVDDSTI
jgi:hypothetical protein